MAINKDKNKSLIITLSNQDINLLNRIVEDISNDLNIELTKSQAIAQLIRNYKKAPTPKPAEQKPTKRQVSDNYNYQAQIRALKDKLNCSFTKLSQILGIPTSTLKKYANGTQQPKEENARIIKNAIARYGIK